jgi:hypothetical protein
LRKCKNRDYNEFSYLFNQMLSGQVSPLESVDSRYFKVGES